MKQTTTTPSIRRAPMALLVLTLSGALVAGCTTTPANVPAGDTSNAQSADARINADARQTLDRLYRVVAGSRDMVARAAGVLVFPSVIGGSLIIGAQHGQGALLIHGRNAGYYSTTSASIGFQAGAGSKAVIYVFNSPDALAKFQASNGWTAGADAVVAVGTLGANGSVSSQTLSQPVVSYVMNNAGVEGGVSVNGSKITKIVP